MSIVVSTHIRLLACLGTLTGITAMLSFGPLTALGVAAGVGDLAPLAPVILTTAAAGSIRPTALGRGLGWRLPLTMLAGTLAGNGLGYLASVHNLAVVVAAVVAVSATTPILLTLVAYLAVAAAQANTAGAEMAGDDRRGSALRRPLGLARQQPPVTAR